MRAFLVAMWSISLCGAATAQIYDQYKSLGDNMALNRAFEGVTAAGVMAGQVRLGQMKIQAGKATTRIDWTGDASVISKYPADQQRDARAQLDAFNAQMNAKGFTQYDIADGFALAFVFAFEAYTGEAPGPDRLKRLRSDLRSAMLKDPFSQGEQMASQQRQYENMAISAVGAIIMRNNGDIANAKALAAPVIQRIWNKQVQNIELTPTGFGDRGERLVSTGTGIAAYTRTDDRAWVFGRISAFAANPEYLAQLPNRFDAEVRQLGWSPDNPDDALTAAFVFLARAQKVAGADTPAFARKAREFIENDSKTNASWVGLDDKSKQNHIEHNGFVGLILMEQQATTPVERNWGQIASAANSRLRYGFRKDFLDHMGVPTIF